MEDADVINPAENHGMKIHIDHLVVPCKEKNTAANFLGELLGAPWEAARILDRESNKPISSYDEYRSERASVYVNDLFTIDFMDGNEPLPRLRYCFRVSNGVFENILERLKARGTGFRSEASGPVDNNVNSGFGGKRIYWDAPDGHNWELLTVSYARKQL